MIPNLPRNQQQFENEAKRASAPPTPAASFFV